MSISNDTEKCLEKSNIIHDKLKLERVFLKPIKGTYRKMYS